MPVLPRRVAALQKTGVQTCDMKDCGILFFHYICSIMLKL